jgi:hypothetical protein
MDDETESGVWKMVKDPSTLMIDWGITKTRVG